MGRVQTILAIALVIVVTIWMQRVLVDVMGPTSPLYQGIAEVTWPVDGDQWAQEMYVAVSVWFMWIIRIGVVVYGFYAEIVRQNVTTRAAATGPPR